MAHPSFTPTRIEFHRLPQDEGQLDIYLDDIEGRVISIELRLGSADLHYKEGPWVPWLTVAQGLSEDGVVEAIYTMWRMH